MRSDTTPARSDGSKAYVCSDTDEALARLAGMASELGMDVEASVFEAGGLCALDERGCEDPLLAQLSTALRPFLGELAALAPASRRPTVIFARTADDALVDAAVAAGADAWLVEEPNPVNLGAAMRFAAASHRAKDEVRRQLDKTRRRLVERAEIERAKYRLMLDRGLSEDEAHELIRTVAMHGCTTMGAVAREVLAPDGGGGG